MKEKIPLAADFKELHELVSHHIESFDYMTDKGLEVMFNKIKPVAVFHPFTKNKLRIWLDNPQLYQPQKEGLSRTARKNLCFLSNVDRPRFHTLERSWRMFASNIMMEQL